MRKKKIVKQVTLIGIFISIFIAFFPIVDVRSFDYDDVTLDINTIFQFQEEAVKKGYLTENVSIQLNLPSD